MEAQQEVVKEVLEMMRKKEVREDLLIELEKDSGFIKFCANWAEHRCTKQQKCSDRNLIKKLQDQIKNYETKMTKMIASYQSNISMSLPVMENKFDSEIQTASSQIFGVKFNEFSYGDTSLWNICDQIQANSMKAMTKFKFPRRKFLRMFFCKKKYKIFKLFAQNSFPMSIDEFILRRCACNIRMGFTGKLGKQFNELKQILPRITQKVNLEGLDINKKQLQIIFYLCRRTTELGLSWCKINLTSVPNLGRSFSDYRIKILNLFGTGIDLCSDWHEHPESFDHLVNGLSQTEWAYSSLESILFGALYHPGSIITEILEKYNMHHLYSK